MAKNKQEYNPDFSSEVQEILIAYLLCDPVSFTQCQEIIKEEYFDDKLRKSIRYIIDYSNKYNALPQIAQVKAATGNLFDVLQPSEQHMEWFLKTIEEFARYKAIEQVIFDGIDLLNQGKGGEIEAKIKAAMQISLIKDLGTDYFADPASRLKRMTENSPKISTGFKSLDYKLYGGTSIGELHIFCGASGAGKSILLQNIAINWAQAGLHVLYVSLELAEDQVALRLDAMNTGIETKYIVKNIDEVSSVIKDIGFKSQGSIIIKRLPEAATTVHTIRALMKEIEIQTGRRIEALVVDYLDLLYPYSVKIDPTNLYVKDKYISEELRGLAFETKVLCVTASQLNRGSGEETDYSHASIAGGISKIHTADGVYGIYAPPHMKEKGEYELQLLKVRDSTGTGTSIKLRYCPASMRLTDFPDDGKILKTSSSGEIKEELKNGEVKKPANSRKNIDELMKKINKITKN